MAKSKVATKAKAKSKAQAKASLASKKTSKANVKSNAKSAAKVKKSSPKAAKAKVAKKVSAKKSATKTSSVANKKSLAKKTTVVKVAAEKKSAAINIKMTPLDDRLLVEVDVTEKKTPGGLYIPETAQVTGNYQGRVLAVGRGHMNKKGKTKPMDVQVGDVILFSEYAGEKYSENGKDIRIIREADVLGVVSNEN